MAAIRNIDFKSGKHIIGNGLNSIDDRIPIIEQHLGEDIMALQYDDCIIDVGQYGDRALTIMVIKVDKGVQHWDDPYVVIRCYDVDDFYLQLQRSICMYPGKINPELNRV